MSIIVCPNCGKEHSINNRFCAFCGEDLEDVILQYKEQKLPVSFNNRKYKNGVKNNEIKKEKIYCIPHPALKNFFRFLLFSSIIGFAVGSIGSILNLLSGEGELYFLLFFIFLGTTLALVIPVGIVESLVKTRGRKLCYLERREKSEEQQFFEDFCDACSSCRCY